MSQPTPADGSASRSRPPVIRFYVLGWLCAAALVAYAQRFPLGVVEGLVRDDLGMSLPQMGWAQSAFFITYAIFQIPGGWLADRWGSRLALAVLVAGCSVAAGVTSVAQGAAVLILARLAAGVGQAGLFPAATNTIARWFPSTERALASGLLTGCMSIGGVVATYLTGYLLLVVSWRWVFVIFAAPGIAWAAGFYLWFRNRPEEHSAVGAAELTVIRGAAHGPSAGERNAAEATPWLALAASRAMWLIAGQQFFRAAGYALFASWFPTYLQEVFGTSIKTSGALTSIPLLGVVIGSPLGGLVSDRLLARTGSRRISRQAAALSTMLGCAALFLAAFFQTRVEPAVTLIAAAAFLGAIAGPIAYAITIDMGGNHVATVFSIMNMSGNIGAAAFPVAVVWMVKRTGQWDAVPLGVAAIYAAGSLCWLLLNPHGTVFDNRPAETAQVRHSRA